MDEEPVVGPWADYLALQNQIADRVVVDHTLWALEDKADSLLSAIRDDTVPTEGIRRETWLVNLQGNRNRKHRLRLKLLDQYAREVTISVRIRSQLDRLIEMERVIIVQNSTSAQEFRLLMRRAADHKYQAIARDEDLSVAAAKTKVCRCRQRLQTQFGFES
jgi:hypothetical protein